MTTPPPRFKLIEATDPLSLLRRQDERVMSESITDDGVLRLRWRQIGRVLAHRVLGAFETVNGDQTWKGRRLILIEKTQENIGVTAEQMPIDNYTSAYSIEEGDRLCLMGMRKQYRQALALEPGGEFIYRQRRRRVLPIDAVAAAGRGHVLNVEMPGNETLSVPIPWPE